MKRKFVAFVLAMAVCANSATTAFAEQAQQPAGEWTEESATHVITGSTVTGTATSESTNSNTEGTTTGIVEGSGETDSGIIGIIGGVDSTTEVTEEETPAESEEPAGETENTVEEQPKEETKEPVVTETIITSGEMTAEVEEGQPETEEKSDTAVAEGSNTIQAGTIFASGEMTAKVKEDSDKEEGSDKKDEDKKDGEDAAAEKAKQEAQKAISDYAKSIGYTDGRRYTDESQPWIPNHEYETEPVIGKDSCEPGKLSDKTLQEGLNLINLIRKVAGLGEVTLDESYSELAQLGALAMAASKDFSHVPSQAGNITDEQYELGKKGTKNGNIGYGHTSLTDSILNGYMYDGDRSNVGTMGHRRWILNPTMGKVGFGQVGDYNDMYAHDNSAENTLTDFVAWPAQNMPLELMPYYNSDGEVKNMPWTCQLGSNYKITSPKNLTVTITRPDGSTYNVPQESIICNSQKYGYTNGCITINSKEICGVEEKIDDLDGAKYKEYGRPQAGDTYTVKIEGVLDKDGNKTTIEYDVNFFELGL